MDMIAVEKITVSKTNPRKYFDKKALEELTESIRTHGVLQPVLVRPLNGNGTYELVAGERRFRAVKAAGLKEIPAVSRELDDKQTLEVQVIENLQRQDLHAMEEAEGYESLMKKHGYSADQIADKIGKSKAYVYARLKLTALCEPARKAFWEGKLNPSTALLIARIPEPELQKKALKEITNGWDGVMAYREAAQHVQNNYMLRLAEAPFDPRDPNLSAAGACTTCPKRTGNQKELFPDVKGADVCTDPVCFAVKESISRDRVVEAAKAKGQEVIMGKLAEKALHGHDYVRLDDRCDLLGYNSDKSWSAVLRNCDLKPELVIDDGQRNGNQGKGKLVPVLKRDEAVKAAKALGVRLQRDTTSNYDQQRKAQAAKRKDEHVVVTRIFETLREKAKAVKTDKSFMRVVATALADSMAYEGDRFMRAGRSETKEIHCFAEKLVKKADDAALPGLIVELIAAAGVSPYGSLYGDNLKAVCALVGIDIKKMEAQVKVEKKPAKANG